MLLGCRLPARDLMGGSLGRRALVGVAALALSGCAVDLGGLGGWYAVAHDVNACRVAVGEATMSDETSLIPHAVRWSPGRPPVDLNGSFEQSTAAAVNDAGVAAGSATIDGQTHAVVWKPNGRSRLLGLGAGSGAADIANDGTIVGYRVGASGVTEAFVRDGATGSVTALPAAFPGAEHYATALNERGDVVGYGRPERWAPVLWKAPDYEPIVLSERTGRTIPSDINERGDVSGTWSGIRIFSTALVWRAGTHEEVELPVPEGVTASAASAINNAGHVVGYTNVYYPSTYRAVRWTLDGGLPTDLGDLGAGSSTAEGVNETGTAVGWANVAETTPSGTPIRHAALFPAPHGPASTIRSPGSAQACGRPAREAPS
jgi:probable HAF family extracellular repeat protein